MSASMVFTEDALELLLSNVAKLARLAWKSACWWSLARSESCFWEFPIAKLYMPFDTKGVILILSCMTVIMATKRKTPAPKCLYGFDIREYAAINVGNILLSCSLLLLYRTIHGTISISDGTHCPGQWHIHRVLAGGLKLQTSGSLGPAPNTRIGSVQKSARPGTSAQGSTLVGYDRGPHVTLCAPLRVSSACFRGSGARSPVPAARGASGWPAQGVCRTGPAPRATLWGRGLEDWRSRCAARGWSSPEGAEWEGGRERADTNPTGPTYEWPDRRSDSRGQSAHRATGPPCRLNAARH
eukprot:scaffold48_cov395-Prasinococcus_capsulatus_cf.AAC.15